MKKLLGFIIIILLVNCGDNTVNNTTTQPPTTGADPEYICPEMTDIPEEVNYLVGYRDSQSLTRSMDIFANGLVNITWEGNKTTAQISNIAETSHPTIVEWHGVLVMHICESDNFPTGSYNCEYEYDWAPPNDGSATYITIRNCSGELNNQIQQMFGDWYE